MVAAINDEDSIMIVIDRNAKWILELAWLVTFLTELGDERTIIRREYLNSMIVGIAYEQETSMMVEPQAVWIVKQAVIFALLVGTNREVDSSIMIEMVVTHSSNHTNPKTKNK